MSKAIAANAYCNLEYNNFSNSTDIKLPPLTAVPMDLYLGFNNLTGAAVSDFAGQNVFLGVQGYNPKANLLNNYSIGSIIKVFNDINTAYPDFSVTQYYREPSGTEGQPDWDAGSSFYDPMGDNSITALAGGVLTLAPGKTVLIFYSAGAEINSGDFLNTNINVAPQKPGVTFSDKDGNPVEYSAKGFNGYVKLTADTPEDITMTVQIGGNAQAYASIAEIDTPTTVLVTFRAYYDGLGSAPASYAIVVYGTVNIGWILVILVCIVVVAISVWYIITWYRNGAVVAPLSDKEVSRANKGRKR